MSECLVLVAMVGSMALVADWYIEQSVRQELRKQHVQVRLRQITERHR